MAAQPQSLVLPQPARWTRERLAGVRPSGIVAGLVGGAAMAAMVVFSLEIVGAGAAGHDSLLVPSGRHHHPSWMYGVWRGLGDHLPIHSLDKLLIALGLLYVIVLACARRLPGWLAVAGVVSLTAIYALAPPLFSTDIFNYVNYARLGVVHHLNPYQHGAAAFPTDPSYVFTGRKWLHTPTAYGPLFTLFSYAFAHMSVAGAMWAFKATAAVAALGCSALIWACARRLGIRPGPAVLFFGLNPLLLVYTIGGGHNDVLMLLPLLAGVYLILDGKPELGGAAIVAAAAIKLTAGVALPFALVASRSRWRILLGAAVAGAVIGGVGYALFGAHIAGFVDALNTHIRLTDPITTIPGYLGHVIGAWNVTPSLRQVLQVGFGVVALVLLVYAWVRRNWLASAAAALLVLVATLGWLLPWYAVWALPLVPLAGRRWLSAGAMALTAVVIAIQLNIYNRDLSRELRAHAPTPSVLTAPRR